MDLNHAIELHLGWKAGLEQALRTGAHPTSVEIERDDACPLGVWLRGEGRVHAQRPRFRHLLVRHAEFHRCAARVVRLLQRGDPSAALESQAAQECHAASETLVTELRAFQRELEHEPAPV